jgi:hypothetical protein
MIKTIRITSIITFVMLLFGLLFKTMHWPGAHVLLTCGTATGILLFIAILAGILPKLSGGFFRTPVRAGCNSVEGSWLIYSIILFFSRSRDCPNRNCHA